MAKFVVSTHLSILLQQQAKIIAPVASSLPHYCTFYYYYYYLLQVRVGRSLVFCVVLCRTLFVLFHLTIVFTAHLILITHLVSSNSSYDIAEICMNY